MGDRVIQQVNDYQREVFNGDIGTITSIDLEEQEIVVQFTERAVTYDYADLAEIALAWAVTVHKSQGSEYEAVFCPCSCNTTCCSVAIWSTQASRGPNSSRSWLGQPKPLVFPSNA